MFLNDFLLHVQTGLTVEFQETLSIIAEHYYYRPTEFTNGLIRPLINPAGCNEGSCKIFAFAKLHGLSQEQTLALFGEYYRVDVLGNPDAGDHANIRTFMRDGWDGITFLGDTLIAK